MPIYEYRCRQCGSEFEVIQRFSDVPLATCRECSGPVDKLVSRSGFQFKGSGWYITDYARKSSQGKDTSPGKESSPSKDTSSAKDSGASSGSDAGGASKTCGGSSPAAS
jgi:putative FmdB family regulatory protein